MALEIATLPASVALRRYGGKILQYVHEDVETHGLLIADGDDVMSPLCKLEVLPARSGNGRVHIRCSYNNKFLGEKAIPWWRRWLSNLWRMNQHGDAPCSCLHISSTTVITTFSCCMCNEDATYSSINKILFLQYQNKFLQIPKLLIT